MTNDPETIDPAFFAWLDGELDEAAAAAMAARVAADPELTMLAQQHRALGVTLRGVFDPVALAPVPDALLEAARSGAKVIDFTAARERRRGWMSSGWGRQAAAMAASLAIGLLAGRTLLSEGGSEVPVALAGGQLVAASALKDSLSTQLASAPAASGPRIGLTFRDQRGAVCRSFLDGAASGLACRDGARWRVRGLFQAPEGQGGAYRMAAGPDPALAALIDSQISGEPMDAAGEAAARTKGWR
ncbi:MAG: anti-sigma factor [Sphingomicrobium sp.]